MKVSLDWLREYAPLDASTEQLSRILVDTGTEVNSIRRIADGAIVVTVLALEPVPQARKPLTLATVDAGEGEPVRVLTAATNLAVGDRVPWGRPGVIPAGWEEPLGVRAMPGGHRSPGMLLSEEELGLGEGAAGILVLEDGRPGQPVHEVLPVDTVLDLEVTTNRPDCLCHAGIARELAAALHEPFREPDRGIAESLLSATSLDGRLAVRIEDPLGCPRFTARVVENVRVGPSPDWLQRRLRAVGLRPISNVVDVTNYVMLELGQPLHAYDLDSVRHWTPEAVDGAPTPVVVRRAHDGERLLALDGREYALGVEDLVVCAGEHAAGIGGVIGGEETAVTPATRHILLEAASWEARRIRATSRRLKLRTDASARFDKGLSDELPPQALDRATALIAELGGGHVLRGVVDQHPAPQEPAPEIPVPNQLVEDVLGTPVDPSESATQLVRLGFAVAQEPGALLVRPPHVRRDVRLPIDVVEEIGRSAGYARIPATLPGRRHQVRGVAPEPPADDAVRDLLTGAGFDEIITWAFSSRAALDRLPGLGEGRALVTLRNPLSEEWSVMRTSLLSGAVATVALNAHRGNRGIRVFEVGRAYWEGARTDPPAGSLADGVDATLPPLPAEPLLLTLGSQADDNGAEFAAACLRHIQAVLASIADELGGRRIDVIPATITGLRPGRSAELHIDGQRAGVLGELSDGALQAFELRSRVAVAEVRLDLLVPEVRPALHFAPPPRHPAVEQDLAVVVDPAAAAGEALRLARTAAGELLESITLIDEYRGDSLGQGRKSWAFHLVMRAPDRTLTGAEAQAVQAAVAAALADGLGAEPRGAGVGR